jgi:hypothetical protein
VTKYEKEAGLFPDSLEEVRASLRVAAKNYENPTLSRLSILDEEGIKKIAEAVFKGIREDISNYLPESLYYNDRNMDEILGYRVRRAGVKVLEAEIEKWEREIHSNRGHAG